MIKMLVDIRIGSPGVRINYQDGIMLAGSCFTEHIGNSLHDLKFDVLQNPNGNIFDPSTIASSLTSYIENKQYTEQDLVFINELWQSWQHHSRYAGMNKAEVLDMINRSQQQAHDFLKRTRWLIITLGTAYSYRLSEGNVPVANCHRAPAAWFNKHLMTTEEIIVDLDTLLYRLFQFNKDINVIFTVSPVRHIRDGLVDNNRSKARLIESVHHLVNKFGQIYYFPSYELVIDVLRDYRFYDLDLVHPNYQATAYVVEQFMEYFVEEATVALTKEVQQIVIARKHKPFQASTEAHRKFMRLHAEKTKALMGLYPFLKLQEEFDFFGHQG